MNNFISTQEKIEVSNYPYSFTLKTTLFDFMEFDLKKGFRHCTQTINPKNRAINKPKKSTYYALIIRFYDEKNHIKTKHFSFNGREEINEGCKFIAENFELFTPTEINYFYNLILSYSIVDCKAACIYGGAKLDELKPIYTDFWTTCKTGIKEGGNLFNNLKLDIEAIEAAKPKEFNPFQVTTH